tara:strand:+ start:256 stop:453 length:198 start_codon:yes stop_codon:yes gene_type:complete
MKHLLLVGLLLFGGKTFALPLCPTSENFDNLLAPKNTMMEGQQTSWPRQSLHQWTEIQGGKGEAP